MIIANGRIITDDIVDLKYNGITQKYDITFKNQKTYSYNPEKVHWLKDPTVSDPLNYRISHNENELWGIRAIYIFTDIDRRYWHICFEQSYPSSGCRSEFTKTEKTGVPARRVKLFCVFVSYSFILTLHCRYFYSILFRRFTQDVKKSRSNS